MDIGKKVGIVTCSREANYGACLQALATQTVIGKTGHSSEILNYSLEPTRPYSPLKQKSLRSFVSSILFYKLRRRQYDAFAEFHKLMKFSDKRLYSKDDYFIAKDNYDVLLVGSDQVWNPNLGFDLDLSLLTFYDDGPKKISYAASFGISELPENVKEMYRSFLEEFDYLSVREVQGQKIIRELTGKHVDVVLDPTMLLVKEEWLSFSDRANFPEKYILMYDQNHSEELIPTATMVAKMMGYKVYVLSTIYYFKPNFINLKGVAPDRFLSLIENAEYVVTDSFHGTVFSIIFHKSFASCCAGSAINLKTRITNLLDEFGLQSCWIDENFRPNLNSSNYEAIEEKLVQRRNESLNYLIESISSDRDIRRKNNESKKTCSGCGLCMKLCTTGAITMQEDWEGFIYPKTDNDKCINCGICYQHCSYLNNEICNQESDKRYIARSKDAEILMHSSSGGIFSELANEFISKKCGSLYGASFNDEFSVEHMRGTTNEERNKMRGSKYIQSDICPVYNKIISDLRSDRKVLFVGTPCQCAAIIQYVKMSKTDASNLFLCDIICHGVSSNSVWRAYLANIRKNLGNIHSVMFRNKVYGNGYNMTIESDTKKYMKSDIADPFIYVFSHNLAIRPSCINCHFKSFNRVGDISIGDFQKAKEYFPNYSDNKGASVILVNTNKGVELFDSIRNRLEYSESSKEAATQVNLTRNTTPYNQRDEFLKKFSSEGYEAAVRMYTEENPKKRFVGTSKRAIKILLGKGCK